MDFLPQFVNKNNVFLEKAKKHSKRLLRLAKTNNNQLNIDNLSQAQEILAQLNGYNSWHDMVSSIATKAENHKPYQHHYITKDITVSLKQDDHKHLEYCSHYPYFVDKEFIYSFIGLELLPYYVEKQSFTNNDLINELYYASNYLKTLNTNSKFSIFFENKPLSTNLYAWQQQIDISTHCGLNLKEAQLFFETEYPTYTTTALSIFFVVKTPITQKNLHNNIIKKILDMHSQNFSLHIRDNVAQYFIDIIKNKKTTQYSKVFKYSQASWLKNLFAKSTIQNSHAFEFITTLYNIVSTWTTYLDLDNIDLTVFHNEYNSDKFNNIASNVNNQSLNNHDFFINLYTGVNNIGIPFINNDNRVNCYDPLLHNHLSIFMGSNDLKNILANYIQYFTILNRYKHDQILPHGFFISNGSHKSLSNLLQKTFKSHIFNKKINIKKDFINMLDLPLGKHILEDSDINSTQLIKILFNIDQQEYKSDLKQNTHNFMSDIIRNLYDFNVSYPKMYKQGIEDIDNLIPLELVNSSWFDLVHYFLEKNQYKEAQICHNQAMPILEDLINTIKNKQQHYNEHFSSLNMFEIINNIEHFIIKDPQYNQPTNIYFDINDLYFIDLNNLDSHSAFFNNLIKKIFNHQKSQSFNDNYRFNSLLLNITDVDLSCEQRIEPLIIVVRESRKWNINISLTAEDICEQLSSYAQTKIITSALPSEQQNINLNYSKINKILDHNEFFIESRRQNNFTNGYYKLSISDELYNALNDYIIDSM